jgi:hypothetical protein
MRRTHVKSRQGIDNLVGLKLQQDLGVLFAACETNTYIVPKPDLPGLGRKDEPWLARTAIRHKSIQWRGLGGICRAGKDVAGGDASQLLSVLPNETRLGRRHKCESGTCVDIANIRISEEVYRKGS